MEWSYGATAWLELITKAFQKLFKNMVHEDYCEQSLQIILLNERGLNSAI
jgi:hypothetical protein